MYEYLKNINCEFYRFDSQEEQVVDVLANIHKHKDSYNTWEAWDVKHAIQREDFIGRSFSTWQDVQTALRQPWDEGLAIYSEMMDQLQDVKLPQPRDIKRRRRWSEERGDEMNIDRLMRGQAYLEDSYRDARPGPVSVTILTDISTSVYVPHANILWRGAAAVLLTELLERAGYRIELWAVNHCDRGYANGRKNGIAVRYKCGGDPLDVSTLINGVSGWCYRTIFFGTYCISDSPPVPNLGYPLNVERIKSHVTQDEHALVCQGVWSKKDAVAWVRGQLERMNQGQSFMHN